MVGKSCETSVIVIDVAMRHNFGSVTIFIPHFFEFVKVSVQIFFGKTVSIGNFLQFYRIKQIRFFILPPPLTLRYLTQSEYSYCLTWVNDFGIFDILCSKSIPWEEVEAIFRSITLTEDVK